MPDAMDEGLLVMDASGAVLYESVRARRLLDRDPEGEHVLRQVCAFVRASRASTCRDRSEPRPAGPVHDAPRDPAARTTLASQAGCYRVELTFVARSSTTSAGTVVVSLVGCPADSLTDRALADRFRLTARETQVARLLAAGCRTSEVAAALGVSYHTARHHTEHVFQKLRISTRALVGCVLRGEARAPAPVSTLRARGAPPWRPHGDGGERV